jgi:hypothetical protein
VELRSYTVIVAPNDEAVAFSYKPKLIDLRFGMLSNNTISDGEATTLVNCGFTSE